MRLFRCQVCGQTIYFENTRCERCGSPLGYLPDIGLMSALEPETGPELIRVLDQTGLLADSGVDERLWLAQVRPGRRYRPCINAAYGVCNWLVPEDEGETRCLACRHNGAVSDPEQDDNQTRWRRLEFAKHRLLYSLLRLGLTLPTRAQHREGLVFEFLADPADPTLPRIITGHAKGTVTIALREADDVERENMRKLLGEPYRTLLGHFRHESGHYFWDRLVRDGGRLEQCRAVFGDDRADYAKALGAYYASGARPGWQKRYISAYATMHPWEDFSETWAHYLHMIDTLETASAHGIELHGRDGRDPVNVQIDFDPYRVESFDPVVESWFPIARAANSLNRSMGLADLYPFVLTDAVIGKLAFIHRLIREQRPPAIVGRRAPRAW